MSFSYKDISGRTFGKWRVSEEKRTRRRKGVGVGVEWLCTCACGIEQWVSARVLLGDESHSCKSCSYVRKLDAPIRRVFRSYKTNAEKRNLLFSLSLDDFKHLSSQPCGYCGVSPSNVGKTSRVILNTVIYSGIDRKDNSLGYILENCISCCRKCNSFKSDGSTEAFIAHCRKVSQYNPIQ